jgi:hypothetical protein
MASWLDRLGLGKSKPVEQKQQFDKLKPFTQLALSFVGGQTVVWQSTNRGELVEAGYLNDNIVFSIQKWKANKIKNCPFVLYRVKSKRKFQKYQSDRKSNV